MVDEAKSTTKSGSKTRRRRGRPTEFAKRLSVGLTDVQLEGLERQRKALQAAVPKGRSVGEGEALRSVIDAGLVALAGGSVSRGQQPPVELTADVMRALSDFGGAFTAVDKTIRHPLGTNANQIAMRLNAGQAPTVSASERVLLIEMIDQIRGLREDIRQAHTDVISRIVGQNGRG